MAEQERWIRVVESLISTSRDSQQGYAQAAQYANDAELRAFCNDQSEERKLFAQELENRVNQLGRHGTSSDTSTSQSLRHAWVALKDKLGAGDDSILASVASAEDDARDQYEKALRDKLPEGIAQTLRAQLQSVLAARDHVQLLRERRKKAA